jgi:hypothetical protein
VAGGITEELENGTTHVAAATAGLIANAGAILMSMGMNTAMNMSIMKVGTDVIHMVTSGNIMTNFGMKKVKKHLKII